MFSYVFMKMLESRPRGYDRGMHLLSGGRVRAAKGRVVASLPPCSHVLEIGCGTGELGAMLVAAGHTVEGFDESKVMVAAARKRIADQGLKGKLEVKRMGVEDMDRLPAAHFDAVVATLVLSELPDGARAYALRHAARVLKPGGMLSIADEVVPRAEGSRVAHRLMRLPVAALTYFVTGAGSEPLQEIDRELAAAGFHSVREQRSHGGSFAVVSAQLPAEAA